MNTYTIPKLRRTFHRGWVLVAALISLLSVGATPAISSQYPTVHPTEQVIDTQSGKSRTVSYRGAFRAYCLRFALRFLENQYGSLVTYNTLSKIRFDDSEKRYRAIRYLKQTFLVRNHSSHSSPDLPDRFIG